MTFSTNLIVGLGLLAAVLLGLGLGFDVGAVVILALLIACGGVAIAVARKSAARATGPRICPDCGGLTSPHAPYCKHCNRGFDAP